MKYVHLFSLVICSAYATFAAPSKRDQGLSSYHCDPAVCKLPSCYCPSTKPPGGLALNNTPQFVLLTFDDAVNTVTLPLEQRVVKSKNPNGCPMPATFFTSTDYTDYHYVQSLHAAGHEIAIHTMTHPANPNASEIDGCRKAINAYAGIPIEDFRGFRAPFLQFDMNTYQALTDLKVQWDCSASVDPRTGPWPFTYDNGFPYVCETGTCDYTRKFPGLWEIPMYSLLDPATNFEYAVMDPAGDPATIMNVLQYNFKIHWEGNRTPMGLWMHAAFFLQDPNPHNDRVALLNEFIAWTRNYTDNQVYYVTGSQLIDWMQNPVGLDAIATNEIFSCHDPSHEKPVAETCNGIDDNHDGNIDEGLVKHCNLGTYVTDTCFTCPAQVPTPSNPVPISTGNGTKSCLSPQGGCGVGEWDASTCMCVLSNGTPSNTSNNSMSSTRGTVSSGARSIHHGSFSTILAGFVTILVVLIMV